MLLDKDHSAARLKVLALILAANAILVGGVVSWKLLKDDPQILVNQVGFLPGQDKIFFVQTRYAYSSGSFDVVDLSTGNRVISARHLEDAGSLWNLNGGFPTVYLPLL